MARRYSRPLTIDEMASRPDADIDFEDIPELGDAFWKNAKLTPPRAKPTESMRLDEDEISLSPS